MNIKGNKFNILITVPILCLLLSCEPTEFDGINVVDPLPEVPITFPQAVGWDNRMQMNWNAFTFDESIGDGQVTVQLQVPEGFTIERILAIRGQRIRGNIGPRINGGSQTGSARFPNRFDRTISPNYGENISVDPGSITSWNISLDDLNAMNSGSLGDVQVGDGLRLYFTVLLSNEEVYIAAEARVILTP
jgi:hypothetical protein